MYHRYQPGKSQLALITFVMGTAQTGATTRIGYFDDSNGIFLERTGTTVQLVRRTFVGGSAVDNTVAQASWNIDPMTGAGPSGLTLDLTKAHILVIDFQWLGVGRVRVAFDINGVIHPVHQFVHANLIASVYATTMCLPVRYEVRNTGIASGALSLETICTSVQSEGSSDQSRAGAFATSNWITTKNSGNNTFVPLLSIRARTTTTTLGRPNRGQIWPTNVTISNSGSGTVCYELRLNATLTNATFAAVAATGTFGPRPPLGSELVEDDVAATAVAGGSVIETGYLPASSTVKFVSDTLIRRQFPLVYAALTGVQDTLTVCVAGLGGAYACVAVIEWTELY